jgi:hypothetical protein
MTHSGGEGGMWMLWTATVCVMEGAWTWRLLGCLSYRGGGG